MDTFATPTPEMQCEIVIKEEPQVFDVQHTKIVDEHTVKTEVVDEDYTLADMVENTNQRYNLNRKSNLLQNI